MKLDDKVALITARHKVSASESPSASGEPAAAWRSLISICKLHRMRPRPGIRFAPARVSYRSKSCRGGHEAGRQLMTIAEAAPAGREARLLPDVGAAPTRVFLLRVRSRQGRTWVPLKRCQTTIIF